MTVLDTQLLDSISAPAASVSARKQEALSDLNRSSNAFLPLPYSKLTEGS